MKLKIRIKSVNEKHVRFDVFQDGGNCGHLCMETDPFNNFLHVLATNDNYFNIEIEDGTLNKTEW